MKQELIEYFSGYGPKLISMGMKVIFAFIAFFIGKKVIRWVRGLVRKSLGRSDADVGVVQFVDSCVKTLLYALLCFEIVTKLGVAPSSIAAILASGGVAIGLALQGSLSNFAGGVLILLLKPFVVGDYIVEHSNGNEGTVKEIQVFYTKLSTPDNKTIVIPNGALANTSLTNVTTADKRRVEVVVGIAYEADLLKAKEILRKLFEADTAIMDDEDINVFVASLGDSSVNLSGRGWTKTEDYWDALWRLQEKVKLAFDAAGIDIPYPQMTIHQAR